MEALYPRTTLVSPRTRSDFEDRRESLAGSHPSLVPAVRMALVKDARLFDYLTRNAGVLRRHQPSAIHHLARRCMQIHEMDRGDDEQQSCRDFGCATAARLERVGPSLKGEPAAFLGMAVDVAYSYLTGLLSVADLERIMALKSALGLPTFSPSLHSLAAEIKRNSKNAQVIPLLCGIGRGTELQLRDPALFEHAVRLLASWGGEATEWPSDAAGL